MSDFEAMTREERARAARLPPAFSQKWLVQLAVVALIAVAFLLKMGWLG